MRCFVPYKVCQTAVTCITVPASGMISAYQEVVYAFTGKVARLDRTFAYAGQFDVGKSEVAFSIIEVYICSRHIVKTDIPASDYNIAVTIVVPVYKPYGLGCVVEFVF